MRHQVPATAEAGRQYLVFKQNTRTATQGGFEGYALLKRRISAGNDRFRFVVTPSTGTANSATVTSTTTVSTNTWYHVVGVRGSNFVQIYVNGQLEAQTNTSFAQDYGTLPLFFGSTGQNGFDARLRGRLDDVALYNRALSSNEIATLYYANELGKCSSLAIYQQPQSHTVLFGDTTSFAVVAGGSAPLHYQWRHLGTNLPGATNYSLTVTNVQEGQLGTYSVVVNNNQESLTSSNATLSFVSCFPALDVVLAIDCSLSMDGSNIVAAIQAATNFVSLLDLTYDQVGLIAFGDNATNRVTLTNVTSVIVTNITALKAKGDSTAMGAGITNAQIELSSVRHNTNAFPLLVLLTDGVPTVPTSPKGGAALAATLAANWAKSSGSRVVTIGLGGGVDAALLRSLATSTNDYYFASTTNALSATYASIAQSICRGTNQPPTVEIVYPADGSTFTGGASLVISNVIKAFDHDDGGSVTNVQLFANGNLLGTASVLTDTNYCFLNWTNPAAGVYALKAVAKDNGGLSATSPAVNITIGCPVSVTFTQPSEGQIFAFSATNILLEVSVSDPCATVTNMAFFQGTNLLGVVHGTSNSYSFLWTNVVAASNYLVVAKSTNSLGIVVSNGVNITVNAMPIIWNVSPTNWQQFWEVTNVMLTAAASDPDGKVTNVTFYTWEGTNVHTLGTGISNSFQYTFLWTNLSAGFFPYFAIATDNLGAQAASTNTVFEVIPTNTLAVTITSPTNGQRFAAGAEIAITASASSSSAVITNVQFFAGTNYLGNDATSPYGVVIPDCEPGEYILVAKATDSLGFKKFSNPVTITVSNREPVSTSGFWDPRIGNPGAMDLDAGRILEGMTLTVGEDRTVYLVSGEMISIDNVPVRLAARWDGANWFELGNATNYLIGFGHGYGSKIIGSELYAGQTLNGGSLGGLLKWDGANWSQIGEEVPGRIRSIAVLGSDIYIGGTFIMAGTNDQIRYVAKLQGTNWAPVPGLNEPVHALAVMGNSLYAGGSFTNVGSSSNVSSDLVSVFQRLSSSWGDQMNSVLQNAILAFLESPRGGTLADLRRFLVEPAFRNDFLKSVEDSELLYYWQKGFSHLTGNKSIGPVLTRMETFLAPKPIRHMVSQAKNRLDFADIMDTGKIFLAKLSQGLLGKENSYLLGTLLVSKFQQTAMSRQAQQAASRRDFTLVVDEFDQFISPSMAEILTGTRKYRLGLVLAHHELRQLQRNPDVASAVLTHCHTRICFRVGDEDARKLAEGFAHFETRDLQNLGTGQAIARVERSDYDFNLAVPLPVESDPVQASERREKVITASRKAYGTRRAEVETALRDAIASAKKQLHRLDIINLTSSSHTSRPCPSPSLRLQNPFVRATR